MKHFLWKIGGEAGFGILTTGLVFSKIASRLGYYVFDFIQYPSLIRGGHNTYDVGFADKPVYSLKQDIDLLVCLNQETFTQHADRLSPDSLVLYDSSEFDCVGPYKKVSVPFKKILTDLKGQVVMKNTIALGATIALLGGDINILYDLLTSQFQKKGQNIVDFNKQFAQAGYDHIQSQYSAYIKNRLEKVDNQEGLVMSGNEVFSLGCVLADCKLYVAYPMTPSSSVLSVLADWQDKTGMLARHAEDEISVINTALGGSIAGVRSAVGTSGGGFALMVETVSFAGIAEIPLVIFLSQRPGPATGMPTWTEQGDLLFAVHAGHGEFPKIVLAPGDNDEMLDLTLAAFDLADIYQTPVIMLSDMLLSESHRSISKQKVQNLIKTHKVDRGKFVLEPDVVPYKRYKITDDGISPRLVPGAKEAYYQSNSYEHLEDGHTSEEAHVRINQIDKRARKMTAYLQKHFKGPIVLGDYKNADTVFITWGSTKGAVQEARKILDEDGIKTAQLHFTYLHPLDPQIITPFFKDKKRYIAVENNSRGQFEKLLSMELGIKIKEKILRYDGRPILAEDIINTLQKNNK
ncbi:MAG: 2-oxoacid:acceptor oxidoreductase subunit alpha [Patescibacteria group bacterium]